VKQKTAAVAQVESLKGALSAMREDFKQSEVLKNKA
jgi:hypothetical protein